MFNKIKAAIKEHKSKKAQKILNKIFEENPSMANSKTEEAQNYIEQATKNYRKNQIKEAMKKKKNKEIH